MVAYAQVTILPTDDVGKLLASIHASPDSYINGDQLYVPNYDQGSFQQALDDLRTASQPTITQRRQAVIAQIDAKKQALFDGGCPYESKLIQVDADSRVNLASMVLAALLSKIANAPWSDGYKLGWITVDNSRLALPIPDDGLALGQFVGNWYAIIVQNARDLKNTVSTAGNPEVIDLTQGWP